MSFWPDDGGDTVRCCECGMTWSADETDPGLDYCPECGAYDSLEVE